MIFKKKSLFFILPLLMIFIFSMIPVSSFDGNSEGFMGYGQLNENKTISITCPTCDYINISTTNPDGTILFSNEPMNLSGGLFSYQYNSTQMEQLGIYQINGYSQLDEPLGLWFDITFSGKENNIGAYSISLIFVIGILLGIIWLNIRFNKKERERLYKQIVLGFFKANKKESKKDFAVMVFYLIGYGILDLIFILYYLDILLILFLFKDLAVSFGLNTFSLLMPQLIIIALWSLTILGAFFTLKLLNIVMDVVNDVKDSMRGIYE